MDRNVIENALHALGERLAELNDPPTGLLVCGGASLIVNKLVSRSTQDVDVLTVFGIQRPDQRDLQKLDGLPEYLQKAAAIVAYDFDLHPKWLSIGPSGLVQLGLPDGLVARAIQRDYGRKLRVFYISRFDLIHLKFYAAIGGGERHLQDLKRLRPTNREAHSARAWIEDKLSDAVLPADLDELMEELGYGRRA